MQNAFLTISCIVVCFFVTGRSTVEAQTCQSTSIPASTPNLQLLDNGDATISDSKTGLMWKKCTEGFSGSSCESGAALPFIWQQALEQPGIVNNTGFAGYTDWRLPNIKELASIVEEQCFDPAINVNRFPATPSSNFWSASANANYSDYAWNVWFYNGNSSYSTRNYSYLVRLVRGGQ